MMEIFPNGMGAHTCQMCLKKPGQLEYILVSTDELGEVNKFCVPCAEILVIDAYFAFNYDSSPSGGIGRREGLKPPSSPEGTGSNPVSGT